ncbi:helix-turn-helix domain-containing protein [Planctomyces sp. SH-PL62]|uniref:helix-turn-helix domain-containing protein n=1 Tax=Planctomyces sp. SH-PL62 TaxID=1636152 RepID=UPI000839283D|nr:helix-turn-helix domain-containing protein [Planctomyces sp. SH-PL62]
MNDEILTIVETGQSLGRSVGAVRQYVRFFGLPSIKVGSRNFVKRSDLDAWRVRPDIAAMLVAGDYLNRSKKGQASPGPA